VTFQGWPPEAISFFEELEADNSKAFWQANKSVYERAVREPLEQLLAELEPEFGLGRAFRPNRDLRFSPDKSPYKTNAAARVGATGYLALSSAGLNVGAGMVHLAPDQLDRYRRAVDDHGAGTALAAAVATIRNAGHEWAPHDPLKTAPKGYPRDHPRIDLLRGRGLIMWHAWPPADWLGTSDAKERIAAVLRASRPLTDWLTTHVGDSAFPAARH
jgi:uncharacterized protein (TIGR02453 family)